ncbi:MAG TPA: DUF2795 domain-containing protein [Thermoleophilaceae bacterium]|jgi:hypothetical protein|nr:DUF2795 domain-containing protein [Thermoleophilaceae bacterium]
MEARGSWIERLHFPATKLDLIDAAEEADAPQPEIERLQRLSREQYESRGEVEAELGPDA